ncbi:RNA polymerase sigma factor SigB [Brevibacillus humidisoli]|uniref:RNA polymerase sigma factor SigB n=1 Tax=Brevibacillus humidisoli TaxID=2895522 RepID=UPI001E60D045|nr:RNA polymerase sigma factor SigB [Brevibacillus humidisoli]UFJ40951.1 RNA polymerase sigma factor SigB [Brevibacillus humidisoli]
MSTNSPKQKWSSEELDQLLAAYQQDYNKDIQNILCAHYRPLVESLASRFSRGQEPQEDLVQVGMIGLLAAFRRYNSGYGRSFESFAIPTVVGEIKRYIRDKTWSVYVPRRIKELGPKIKKAVDELTAQMQCSPQIADIARYMNVSEEEVLETMEMGRNYHSLSVDSEIETDSDGSTITLLDLIGREDSGYTSIEDEITLSKALQVLTPREKAIIHLTFYENMSQKQAGDVLGISQMHVSRLQRRALMKLREALRASEWVEERQRGGFG